MGGLAGGRSRLGQGAGGSGEVGRKSFYLIRYRLDLLLVSEGARSRSVLSHA